MRLSPFFIILLLLIFWIPEPFPPVSLSSDIAVQYNVSSTGITDSELRKFIEDISDTISLKERPPASLSLLQKRIEQDIPRMISGLRSRGYYSARVDYDLNTGARPVNVRFRITPGPPFILKSVDVQIEGEALSLKGELLSNNKIRSSVGSPINSKQVIDIQDAMKRWLMNRGFPQVSMNKPCVIIDHSTQTASVTYIIRSGPKALFGDVHVEGLRSVDESFVRKRIPWKEGDVFNAGQLSDARKNLSDTLLFTTVDVEEGQTIDKQGRIAVYIQLRERKHRTIRAGVSFKTDEGPGGKVSWEHRNMFNKGERLNVSGIMSGIDYSAEGLFHKPDFFRNDQILKLNVRLAEDHPDTFTSRSMTSLANVERSLSEKDSLGAGIGYRMSRITQFGREDRFNLISLSLGFDRDTRKGLLDPTAGGHLSIQMTPFQGIFGTDLTFLQGQVGYSHYFRLSTHPYLVLAAKGDVGATQGASYQDIPADIRFYAGGGGSVRGYAYQTAGPLLDGVPTGGNSLISLSTELRTKLSDTIGLVFFIDGGSVFLSSLPDFEGDFFWGAGVGFRYFTTIGPLRFDVGLPLNRRDGMDDPFQIYVSLGQAF